jgi:hypothetical protein
MFSLFSINSKVFFVRLREILPELDTEHKMQLLSTLLALHFTPQLEHAAWRIRAIIAYLTPDLVDQALQISLSMDDELSQLKILPTFVDHFEGNKKQGLLQRIWALAAKYPGSTESGDAVAVAGPYISQTADFRTALEVLRPVKFAHTDHYYGMALHNLAPHLPESPLPTALELYLSIRHSHYQNIVLETLGPRLKGDLLQFILHSALEIRDAENQAATLAVLAPVLPNEAKLRSLTITLEGLCEYETFRADALRAWLPQLPDDLRMQAVEAILNRNWGHDLHRLLTAALPYLADETLERAVNIALDQIADTREPLQSLLPNLSQQKCNESFNNLLRLRTLNNVFLRFQS